MKGLHNHFTTKEEAGQFYDKLPTQGTLKAIKESKSKKVRPKGLNTVNMLKFVTKYMGFSSHDAMKCAERLYLSGYITYPRTESTHYPSNFNFENLVDRLSEEGRYKTEAQQLK